MEQSMIRHSSNTSESWKNLPWKKFRKDLFRLQKRVFKAVQAGNKRKAQSLQRLILKSKAARFLAIRQVTQLNDGKKTAGIDDVKSLDFTGRFDLETILKESAGNWHHQGLREIPILKKDGTTRMLKIPTIADRTWQCLAKYALEPAHEATFHAYSYGFRSGRSAHDAQKLLFLNLRSSSKGIDKRVIELDIEKCFDRISHATIMDNLIAPKGVKVGIFRCLKAGVNPDFPEQGTPQGGVVSPLLANIALNGIESIHRYHKDGFRITDKTPASNIVETSIRYADDMVIMLRPQDDADRILAEIDSFLAARGMMVSAKKTKITATTDGFDFLGWHFKVLSDGRFKSYPSVDNFKKFRLKVKNIVNCSNYGSQVKAEKLAPIVRGWRNYHRFCDMSGSRFSLWFLNHRTYGI
jgi:group II intron reverse transcriptase/maturase